MRQNYIADYLSCILFRGLSFFNSFLPLNFSFYLGRRLGDLVYFFDKRHRVTVYANIRKAFPDESNPAAVKKITRKAYRAFGQNLIEISFIPRINKKYFEKYINLENKDNIQKAFNRGKGVIFLIVHEGNWELSNIISSSLGFPFVLFIRDQGFPRLNALLNSYRLKHGARIIHKDAGGRQLIEALRSNQAIGMTVDQGGKSGQIVKFFGKEASMSIGAVKLALKYDCSIIPVFYTRIKGPYTKVILDQVFTVTRSTDPQEDLRQNLQRLINIYEKYIRLYPHEYLWTYKIWKYGKEKQVLVLSDGKTGHLRQSEAAAKLLCQKLAKRSIKVNLVVQEVKFRSKVSRSIFACASYFSGKYQCQGCLCCLRKSLTKESWQSIIRIRPDIIISAGSSVSAVNYLLARENQAKSIVLMRPFNLGLNKFDLVIMPKHDYPPLRENVVITEGALNLIDGDYLKQRSKELELSGLMKNVTSAVCIGLLIGGDSKKFRIDKNYVIDLCCQVKKAAEELDADIIISTSRRSSYSIEQAVKGEFLNYTRCKLLVIANENNHPAVVGGLLSSSNIVVCTAESISMVSEAVSAVRYVFVTKAKGLSKKHRRFLDNYQKRGFIYLKEVSNLSESIKNVYSSRPEINIPQNNSKVAEALNRII